ncbi:MAG TPA: HTTM domain-containing protein [Polyangiaceae bacterium]|nr:HTTM domain-containing protein [Polyangiaceae bacterium]
MRTLTALFEALRRQRHALSSGRAEALARVGFAFVLLIQLAWLYSDVEFFYSTESPSPPNPTIAALYTPALVRVAYVAWCASAALMLVGLFTRVATVGAFLGCLYFLVLRQPLATHAADWLIPSMAFQMALLPGGHYLALDRRFRPSSLQGQVPAWPLRLAQLSVAFFYFTAGSSKLGDVVWRHGKGFFMTFANPALSHHDFTWLARLPFVSPALNYAVVAWECAMPLLLLWRCTRLFAIVSAFSFLVVIDLDLPVGWFAWFCVANLLVFVDDTPRLSAMAQRLLGSSDSTQVRSESGSSPRGGWREPLVNAFLVFHLVSFAWMQAAYALLAGGSYELGVRLASLPVLGTYGYAVANVRYYALWPGQLFSRLPAVYLELEPRGGSAHALPPFDDAGRLHLGWLESRNVREQVMASFGVSGRGWQRYFTRVGQRYADATGRCPQRIRAYRVLISPGSFGTDLRRGKTPLPEAWLTCSSDMQVSIASSRTTPRAE